MNSYTHSITFKSGHKETCILGRHCFVDNLFTPGPLRTQNNGCLGRPEYFPRWGGRKRKVNEMHYSGIPRLSLIAALFLASCGPSFSVTGLNKKPPARPTHFFDVTRLKLHGGSESGRSFEYISPREASTIKSDVLRMWHISEQESLREKELSSRVVEISALDDKATSKIDEAKPGGGEPHFERCNETDDTVHVDEDASTNKDFHLEIRSDLEQKVSEPDHQLSLRQNEAGTKADLSSKANISCSQSNINCESPAAPESVNENLKSDHIAASLSELQLGSLQGACHTGFESTPQVVPSASSPGPQPLTQQIHTERCPEAQQLPAETSVPSNTRESDALKVSAQPVDPEARSPAGQDVALQASEQPIDPEARSPASPDDETPQDEAPLPAADVAEAAREGLAAPDFLADELSPPGVEGGQGPRITSLADDEELAAAEAAGEAEVTASAPAVNLGELRRQLDQVLRRSRSLRAGRNKLRPGGTSSGTVERSKLRLCSRNAGSLAACEQGLKASPSLALALGTVRGRASGRVRVTSSE